MFRRTGPQGRGPPALFGFQESRFQFVGPDGLEQAGAGGALLRAEARGLDGERRLLPKNAVKLLLNLCLIAASAIPRGGVITVEFEGEGEALTMTIEAAGTNARLPHAAAAFLSAGAVETVDGHSIQPYYATLLARECGKIIRTSTTAESVVLTALPEEQPDGAERQI